MSARSPVLVPALVAVLVLAGLPGTAHGSPAQEGGDSRVEDLVDSRVLVLESGTVIREDETPVIDRTSRPDQEVISIRTDDVLFEFGSADLTPQAGRIIEEAVSEIQALGDPSRLVISGHTDHVGSDSSNQVLSEDRAAAVDRAIRDELGSGAPPTDVSGRGESEPVAPNEYPDGSDNPDGRALNRRVEVEVIP